MVLKQVCDVTGAAKRDLRQAKMGPHANPARRFAVWALKRQTLLTHAEIGKTLQMTTVQVGNVLTRLKLNRAPFEEWTERWLILSPSDK